MSIETELKLRITPDHLPRLKRHALLRSCCVSRPVTRRLYNIYFDTPKFGLHKAAMALRLRRSGRQWLQTLKGGGSAMGGLHQRSEWEVPVSGPALDFSATPSVEWEALLPLPLRKKLQPVFVTDFSRSSRMLNYQGAEIELCMDQGQVFTEQRSLPLCELELELKSGEPRQLFELALAILEIAPFELEIVSKAEQGYRLLSGYVDKPVKGLLPDFAKSATVPDVLQALIWSCFQHLQSNLAGALHSDDAEYLHQMRVALRRLRVVLRLTEKFRADETLSALGRDVSVLCVALGQIREWDVFVAQTLRPMCERMGGHAGLQALLSCCERQREDLHEKLRSQQQCRELQRLMLRFSIWMYGPYWQLPAEDVPLVQDFAAYRLCKLAKKFTHYGKQLKAIDATRLHDLRILAKKLRYSAEFFSSLFEKQKSRAFLASLSDVQEVLGQINDVAVAHRLLDELAMDATSTSQQEAVVLARGWIAHDLSRQFILLRKTMLRFNKQSRFWLK